MNYLVTCVCGHRFYVTPAQLGRHATCPSCNRALIPVVAEPAGDDAVDAGTPAEIPAANPGPPQQPATGGAAQATKRCPFCGETILAVARKCRFCNEFLDRDVGPAGLPLKSAAGQQPPPAAPQDETVVFAVCVSQWDNVFRYFACVTVAAAAAAVLYFLPKKFPGLLSPSLAGLIFICVLMVDIISAYLIYLGARTARCVIRPTRIETEVGIFSKQTDSLELFRVTDLELKQNVLQRLLGIGTVLVKSNDVSSPLLEIYHVPQVRKIYKYLQTQVPIAAKNRSAFYLEK